MGRKIGTSSPNTWCHPRHHGSQHSSVRDYSALRLNFLCEAGRQGGLVAVEAVEERQAEHEAAQHHEHVVEDEEEKQKRPER